MSRWEVLLKQELFQWAPHLMRLPDKAHFPSPPQYARSQAKKVRTLNLKLFWGISFYFKIIENAEKIREYCKQTTVEVKDANFGTNAVGQRIQGPRLQN